MTQMNGNIVLEEFDVNGETLTHGREFKVRGSNSKFTFIRGIVAPAGTWIEAVGPKRENRAFDPAAITKVVPIPKNRRPKS